MSIMSGMSRFAAEWKQRRLRRQTEALIASLPEDLRRDIGWPGLKLYAAGRTRALP